MALALQLFYWAFLLAICAHALWRGGGPERIVGATMVVASIISVPASSSMLNRFSTTEIGLLLIDTLVLLIFLLVAAYAARVWTLWAAVLQLLDVATHFAKLAYPVEIIGYVYGVTAGMWAFPILICLCCGTIRHRRRLTSRGRDPSWSKSSKPRSVTKPKGPRLR